MGVEIHQNLERNVAHHGYIASQPIQPYHRLLATGTCGIGHATVGDVEDGGGCERGVEEAGEKGAEIEVFVLLAGGVEVRVFEQFFFGVFLVEDCVADYWEGGEDQVEELEEEDFVEGLAGPAGI